MNETKELLNDQINFRVIVKLTSDLHSENIDKFNFPYKNMKRFIAISFDLILGIFTLIF